MTHAAQNKLLTEMVRRGPIVPELIVSF